MKYQNIWGVGRNFKDHAQEMKAKVPSSPLIFLKSGASVNPFDHRIVLPKWAKEVHHEVELAVQIKADGTPIKGTVALDLTERHYQSLAKNKGEPWTLAKSFKNSTVLAPWQSWNKEFLTSDIQLKINGEVRQFGNMRDLIFSVDQVIQFLVEHFPVCEGDVILMGTPAGVGPINDGDFLEADLGPFVEHHWNVEQSVDTF